MKKFLVGLDKEMFILDLEWDIIDVLKIEVVLVGLIDFYML